MVGSVLRAADPVMPLRLEHAVKAKGARAEPVATLYETGRVRHRGMFKALEDELCGLTPLSYEGPGRSPDRADALVWALSVLMLGHTRAAAVRTLN
jgi:phage terminase large subunit-like protein